MGKTDSDSARRGVCAEESVEEDSGGPGAVAGFDPSTWLRTGPRVVGRPGDLQQGVAEGLAVVGDFEDVLLDDRLEWIVASG